MKKFFRMLLKQNSHGSEGSRKDSTPEKSNSPLDVKNNDPKNASFTLGHIVKIVLSLASIPAIGATAFAIFSLVSQTVDKKSIITLKVNQPPEIWEKAGLGQKALESRLAGELNNQLQSLSLPFSLPGTGTLPAALQKLEADAKIEVGGTDVLLRPLSSKVRNWMGREDIEIEIFISTSRHRLPNGDLGDEGFLVRIVSTINDIATVKLVFVTGMDVSIATYAYDQFEIAIADSVSPLIGVAARSKDLANCRQNECGTLLAELITLATFAETEAPIWDDAHARFLSMQFKLIRDAYSNGATSMWTLKLQNQTPGFQTRSDEIKLQLDALLAAASEDPTLLMQASMMAALIGDYTRYPAFANKALMVFAKTQGLEPDFQSICLQPPKKGWAKSGTRDGNNRLMTLGTLCLSRIVSQIPAIYSKEYLAAVKRARTNMFDLLRWAGDAPGLTAIAASTWQRVSEDESISMLKNSIPKELGPYSAAFYGFTMLKHNQPWAALYGFSKALSKLPPKESDEVILNQAWEAAEMIGLDVIKRGIQECSATSELSKLDCRANLSTLMEAAPVEYRTVPAPKKPKRKASAKVG